MTPAFLLLIVFLSALFVVALPTGRLLACVLEGGGPRQAALEARIVRLLGLDATEMSWRGYTRALLVFNLLGFLVCYLLFRFQGLLPWADGKSGLRPDTAFNAAISFVTNTNWQAWAGEATMSNFSQMAGLAVQNFLSAATGLAVAMVLIRGFAREKSATVGNFWLDVLRGTAFVLLPLSFAYALFLTWQGCRRPSPPAFPTARSKAARRAASRSARWLRRKRSRCWAPTAAASTTPTRPTRSRTPPRWPTWCRCWRFSCCRPASAPPSGCGSATSARAGRSSRR